jgi:hypothetical protein
MAGSAAVGIAAASTEPGASVSAAGTAGCCSAAGGFAGCSAATSAAGGASACCSSAAGGTTCCSVSAMAVGNNRWRACDACWGWRALLKRSMVVGFERGCQTVILAALAGFRTACAAPVAIRAIEGSFFKLSSMCSVARATPASRLAGSTLAGSSRGDRSRVLAVSFAGGVAATGATPGQRQSQVKLLRPVGLLLLF